MFGPSLFISLVSNFRAEVFSIVPKEQVWLQVFIPEK